MLKTVASLCVVCTLLAPIVRAAGYGFDVLTAPADYAQDMKVSGLSGRNGTWMRVRGLIDSRDNALVDQRTVESDRSGLLRLRSHGIKTAVLLWWHAPTGSQGGRSGSGAGRRLPIDLREAYEHGRNLGATYGDLVDVWEIENEPDIGFVADNPETYAAFLKAVYLGLHDGIQGTVDRGQTEPRGGDGHVQSTWPRSVSDGVSEPGHPLGGRVNKTEGRGRTEYRGQGGEDGGRRAEAGPSMARVDGANWLDRKRGGLRSSVFRSPSSVVRLTAPRVIMAPLALPPGPYLERLWANDIASYTDGFNFHYYGYAEDFTGVYRQFEDAVGQLTASESRAQSLESRDTTVAKVRNAQLSALSSRLIQRKTLPVFITEYGYGLLDAEARNTVEGRVRQWRWFASVANQLRSLRPEGPMAFLLNPYYEGALNEFGLTMAAQPELSGSLSPKIKVKEDGERRTEDGEAKGAKLDDRSSQLSTLSSQLSFTASDFGAKRPQPWMDLIGQKLGDAYASPALAYLWDYAERHPYRSRDWSVEAAPPSPVVIDFIAGTDLTQVKVSGGYRLQGVSAEWTPHALRQGDAKLVLYNFGAEPVTGELAIAAPNPVISTYDNRVTLAPGERREIPLRLSIDGAVWKAYALKATFIPLGQVSSRHKAAPTYSCNAAVFATALYPAIYGLKAVPIETFAFTDNGEVRAQVSARPLASEEPRLQDQGGRWLATDGVRVEEKDGLWRIHIDHLAETPLRPAAVELPLPRGFVFPADTVFSYQYRIGQADRTEPRGGDGHAQSTWPRSGSDGVSETGHPFGGRVNKSEDGAAKHQPLAGAHGDGMTVYIRTANGNLYFAGSRLSLTPEWRAYAGRSQDFTMGFFGRAALPWRFADNTPVSLFIYLRPSQLPTVFEIRDARIVRFTER